MFEKIRVWARLMKRDAVALWIAKADPRTPWHAKALAVLVVVYALSPIDLVPDFIPVLGYVDDVLLLPALIWLTIRLIPPDVMRECRRQAETWLNEHGGRPRLLAGAAFVVAVWIGAVWMVYHWASGI